jgi:hypothetical protein
MLLIVYLEWTTKDKEQWTHETQKKPKRKIEQIY